MERRPRRPASPIEGKEKLIAGGVAAFVLLIALFMWSPWASNSGGTAPATAQPSVAPTAEAATPIPLFVLPTAAPTQTPQPGGATATQQPGGTAVVTPGVAGVQATPAAGATATRPQATVTPTLPPGATSYVVKSGDNLYDIARSNGLTVEELMAANGLSDRRLINVGQRLVIPPKPNR